MIDVLKYTKVIENVMQRMRVPRNQQPDMAQECYVAMLEKQRHLEDGLAKQDDLNYAASICRSTIVNVYRAKGKKIKTESLDDPRNYHKATKVQGLSGMRVSDEQLQDAIMTLPYEDYQVIWSLYFDGKTERVTAADLGVTRWAVQVRRDRAVLELRKYFEENV